MKGIISLVLLVAVMAGMLVVCGCGNGEGITAAERVRIHDRCIDTGIKQMNDDLDRAIFYTDRPDRTTPHYIR